MAHIEIRHDDTFTFNSGEVRQYRGKKYRNVNNRATSTWFNSNGDGPRTANIITRADVLTLLRLLGHTFEELKAPDYQIITSLEWGYKYITSGEVVLCESEAAARTAVSTNNNSTAGASDLVELVRVDYDQAVKKDRY